MNHIFGWSLFAFWTLLFRPEGIELALGFAMVVIVPMALKLLNQSAGNRLYDRLLLRLEKWILLFSLSGLASIVMESLWFAVFFASIWFVATSLIAFSGLLQLATFGIRQAEEVLIQVGCMYLAVGGGWFILSAGEAGRFLHYSQTIVDLTAIHFHYSAFILPIVCGMLGRALRQQHVPMRGFSFLASGILVGPILIAVGIEVGPPVEPMLVLIYIWFVFWFALISIGYSFRCKGVARATLLISSIVLIAAMVLSYLYSAGLAWAPTILTIPEMVRFHGMANAFGFALLAMIAWTIIAPKKEKDASVIPISPLRGRQNIQSNLIKRTEISEMHALIESWDLYKSHAFDPIKLAPLVARFHEQTDQFSMEANVTWHQPFKGLRPVIRFITKRMKQLHIPIGRAQMQGSIYKVDDEVNGRAKSNVWLRQMKETEEPIFTAAYSSHQTNGIMYSNIALPLPIGVLTGVLLPENDEHGGLFLTANKGVGSDAGVYISFGGLTLRTPIGESLHLTQIGPKHLHAKHELTVWGLSFVTLIYNIESSI